MDMTVRIVPFQPALRRHFYELNVAWIAQHFVIEPPDERLLLHPEQELLAKGGCVLFALLGDEVVGTCALKAYPQGELELTKMAVAPGHQRRGVGQRLMAALIEEFETRGGRKLWLETSTKLEPALRLYERIGFVRQAELRPGSEYARADVYMIYGGKSSPCLSQR